MSSHTNAARGHGATGSRKKLYRPPAATVEWETPTDLFDYLWDYYGPFDFDPCCAAGQHSTERILAHGGNVCVKDEAERDKVTAMYGVPAHRVGIDGLGDLPWGRIVWMNPPYGREIVPWVERAERRARFRHVARVVGLLPVRTDTRWWQENVIKCFDTQKFSPTTSVRQVFFLPTLPGGQRYKTSRLRFGGATQGADFPSAVVVWEGNQ